MNKTTRILLGIFAALFLVHAVLSVTFVCYVSDMEADIRRSKVRDTIYLRALIQENEDRIDVLENSSDITGGVTAPTPDLPCCNHDHDAVEIPEENPPTTAAYILRKYRDLLGVFDGNGQLLRVINVYCDTLPETDRTALEQGITVSTLEELLFILDAYA